jgi:carbon-monoxide dehydrogenase iron sulfur subunit
MAEKTQPTVVAVDLERCLACRSCEMACAKAHAGFEDIVEAVLAGAHMVPRVRVVAAGQRGVPVQCQHCEDAPCAAVCPSGAIYREPEGGPLRTAAERCIGCKACVLVCPFGSVHWDYDAGKGLRCDLCEEIVAAGEEPRCVAACPTRARHVVRIEELSARRRKEAALRTVQTFQESASKK